MLVEFTGPYGVDVEIVPEAVVALQEGQATQIPPTVSSGSTVVSTPMELSPVTIIYLVSGISFEVIGTISEVKYRLGRNNPENYSG